MNKFTIGAALAILLAAVIVGHFDAEDEQIENEQYCEMVGTWKQQAAAGVPKERRDGWPPFKGEAICHGK